MIANNHYSREDRKDVQPAVRQDCGADFPLKSKKTPVGNTGLPIQPGAANATGQTPEIPVQKSVEPIIDWVQGCCDFDSKNDFNNFMSWIGRITKTSWELSYDKPFTKGRTWENQGISNTNAIVAWSEVRYRDEDGRPGGYYIRCWLSLNGSTLTKRIGLRDSWSLVKGLHARGFEFTRLDCKVRLPEKLLHPKKVANAAKKGNLTGCDPKSKSGFSVQWNYWEGQEWMTVYLGSPSSNNVTCCYSALPKHGVIATDYERRMSDEVAQKAALILSELSDDCSDSEIAQLVGQIAIGHCRFMDRSKNRQPCRCPLLKWWAKIVELVGKPLKISIGYIPPTFKSQMKWIENQVIPTLTAIFISKGGDFYGEDAKGLKNREFLDWLYCLMRASLRRFSPKLKAILKDSFKNKYGEGYEMMSYLVDNFADVFLNETQQGFT